MRARGGVSDVIPCQSGRYATRTVALMTAEMAKRTSLDALKCRVGF